MTHSGPSRSFRPVESIRLGDAGVVVGEAVEVCGDGGRYAAGCGEFGGDDVHCAFSLLPQVQPVQAVQQPSAIATAAPLDEPDG